MNKFYAYLCLLGISLISLEAHGSLIQVSFSGVDNTGGTICVPGDRYEENGFQVTAASLPSGALPNAALCAWFRPAPFNPDPDGAALYMNYSSSTAIFERADGGLFDFVSIDLADIYNYGVSGDVEFLFGFSGGTQEALIVTLDQLVGLQTFAVGRSNLLSFGVTALTTPGAVVQFDNLVASVQPVAVPEPATLILLSLGLAGLGVVKRRRQSGIYQSDRLQSRD